MKLKYTTYFLVLFLMLGSKQNTTAQCLTMPTTPTELAACNMEIAQRFAPRHRQEVDTDGEYEDGLNGRSDFLTAINYDGDWVSHNNWENLSEFPNSQFNAYVYYSVVWTKTHWYIVYGYFHPRDWTHHNESVHENDLEGILVVVRRTGEDVIDLSNSVLEAGITVFHKDFYSYTTSNSSFTDGAEDIDGELKVHGGTHPKTAQESEGHGCRSWDDIDEDEEGEVVYRSNTANVSEAPNSISDSDVKYALVDIFEPGGLWSRRNNWSTFAEWGKFNGGNGGANKACAPWAWDDHNDGPTYAGEMGVDPANLVDHYFNSSYPISDCYQFLPYKCNYYLSASKTMACSGEEVTFTIKRTGNLPINISSLNWNYSNLNWECVSNNCDGNATSITLRPKDNFSFTLPVSANLISIDCGPISNTQMTKYISPGINCADPEFHLEDATGQIQYDFCGGEDIFFDGTASQNETSFYIALLIRPIGSTGSFSYFDAAVIDGQAGYLNLAQALGITTIPTGYEYKITLGVKNATTGGWATKEKYFNVYASCCKLPVNVNYNCQQGRITWAASVTGDIPNQYKVRVVFDDPRCCGPSPSGNKKSYVWTTTNQHFDLPFINISNCFSIQIAADCGNGDIAWSDQICSGCKKKPALLQMKVLGKDGDLLTPEVYPNPTNGLLNVSLKTPENLQIEVALYDVQGHLIQQVAEQEIADGQFNLALQLDRTLPRGIYFILLKTNYGVFQKRIILQE